MSKRSSAFFKYAAAFGALNLSVSVGLVISSASAVGADSRPVIARAEAATSLPQRDLFLSGQGGRRLRVGDTVSYEIRGGDANTEARWQIDPKEGGLKKGILFRPGRLITPLTPGEFKLPSLMVLDENGAPVARTEPITFLVESNLPLPEGGAAAGAAPKPEPAIGPLGLPTPLWVQSTVGTLVLIGLFFAVFFIIRALKRRAARALKAMLPKKPYDVASLERLDDLLKKGLIEKRDYKPFYFGLSDTLKFYLGERFDFDARESTTSELFALLRERAGRPGLNEGVVTRIEKLFEALDPVKFADRIPTEGEARAAHRETKEIVLATRKVQVEPVGGARR